MGKKRHVCRVGNDSGQRYAAVIFTSLAIIIIHHKIHTYQTSNIMGRYQHVLFLAITAFLLELSTTRAAHLRRNTHNNVEMPNEGLQQRSTTSQERQRILQSSSGGYPSGFSISGYMAEPAPSPSSSNEIDLDEVNVPSLTGGPFLGPEFSMNGQDNEGIQVDEEDINDNIYNRDDMVVTKRIVGGSNAAPHPFHSMLLLSYGGGYRWAGCGATLISNCHVLTAAHCAMDPSKPLGAVFVNAHRPYDNNGGLPYHFSTIQSVASHAGFNDTTNENDIAVIQMTDCVDVTEFPPAIPANPSMNLTQNHNLMADILGFGKMSEYASMFTNVETLQIAHVPVISSEQCFEDFYGDRIQDDMICGGYAAGGVDACQGDSGSSMTIDRTIKNGNGTSTSSTVIMGVVSWGVGCGRTDSPGVYSSVAYHYDWIARHVCPEPSSSNVSWCEDYIMTPTGAPSPPPSSAPSVYVTEAATYVIDFKEQQQQQQQQQQQEEEQQKQKEEEEAEAEEQQQQQQKDQQKDQSSKQRTYATGSTEPINIATTRSANIATLVGEDRSSTTFWDPIGGCKTADHECSDGSECCSGVCEAGSCIPPTLFDANTKRTKRTRGARARQNLGQ